jgi:hypothetical protein
MNISINNEPKEITAPINLTEVLSVINISSHKGIAIAMNRYCHPSPGLGKLHHERK